jgi:hypothetical protein
MRIKSLVWAIRILHRAAQECIGEPDCVLTIVCNAERHLNRELNSLLRGPWEEDENRQEGGS